MWSDPIPEKMDPTSSVTFVENTARKCSYYYGYASYNDTSKHNYYSFSLPLSLSLILFSAQAVKQFLRANSLVAVVRGHECKDNGFQMHFPRSGANSFPTVITLFSCPNYVDSFKNQAAILIVKKEKIQFKQFTASPHPYFLPNFFDVFHLSLPYVAENMVAMMLAMLTQCTGM